MKGYKTINNLLGWFLFLIACVVYLSTLEPTVSLWDCGEFIATSFKLEVGHPPGAPLFVMLARISTLLSADKSHVAVMINSLSAIASAFTILFLFWTITRIAKKLLIKADHDYSHSNILAVFFCGSIGALSFCFSDSFWFSAVEAEVYGMSSFFTALIFWAVLKWEEEANQKYGNRWLVLISYLLGLSIGIHLLNLLVIPALVLIYYFKKYPWSWSYFYLALFISFLLLLGMIYLIIPGNIRLASLFEFFFINSFGLPVNSGLLIYLTILTSAFIFVLYYTYLKKAIRWNTIVLCLSMILLGYSSYAMIIIRANANPPINTNKPNNALSLLYYLNREQYGDTPLLYGPYYNAPILGTKVEKPIYDFKNGKYVIASGKRAYIYDKRFLTYFPRMYSSNSSHIAVYKDWGSVKGTPTQVMGQNGEIETVLKPTFFDNLEFFITYQLGYMYLRYFMWNFSGKQNDLQGNNGIMHGNWISGFSLLDNLILGPQNKLPFYLKENKGHNRYFMLPLLLGILGLWYHASKSSNYFVVILTLFVMTGIAVAVYNNPSPLQARERDYIYTGSFYAFSIWIGLGVLSVFHFLKRYFSIKIAVVIAGCISVIIPLMLITQNWDDHDRSRRYFVREMAYNYLMSCAPNAILFTVGDNDTFPLWYLQEVEGIRTDVRVVNLMLLNTDWYIDQMRRKQYQSEALPISFNQDQYISGKREIIYILNNSQKPVTTNEAIKRISNDDLNTKIEIAKDNYAEYIPSSKLILSVNKTAALECGALTPENFDQAEDSIVFTLSEKYLDKSELLVMDILTQVGWKRPVYFTTPGYKGTLGLDHYMQLEGFAYRLVPIYSDGNGYLNYGRIETKSLYDQLMHRYRWGNIGNEKVLRDDHIMRTLSILKIRNCFARLALGFVAEGKFDKGIEVLDRCNQILPFAHIPYDVDCIRLADAYYKCGDTEQGNNISIGYGKQLISEMEYFMSLDSTRKEWTTMDRNITLLNYKSLQEMLDQNGQQSLLKPYKSF